MLSGLTMDDYQLSLTPVVERAEQLSSRREVVYRRPDGTIERTTMGACIERGRRLAGALKNLGVGDGDRVASLMWNQPEHLEMYFSVPAMGAVIHTINPRLHPDELTFIAQDAEDKVVVVDETLLDVLGSFQHRWEHVIVVSHSGDSLDGATDYEALISDAEPAEWPEPDERRAAAMCYTSGTTGRPKGALYSHRALVLHSLVGALPDQLGLASRDTLLPVVPMFHVNAWGLPYMAAFTGAGLVLPGPKLDAISVLDLLADERVTMTAGVPTIWQGILQLEDAPDLSSVREIMCGGSAVPEALIRAYDERFGIPILQGWGMTETSPLASTSRVPAEEELSDEERYKVRACQGRVLPLVDYRIDEESGGELQVRGPWIARAYYNDESSDEKFTEDGWLRTGDVAEMVHGSYIKLVDRTKDLVKSGGEWISSVELENEIMAHPDVLEAAVIAIPDERWGERPCACVVRKEGSSLDAEGVREHLKPRVAKWWIPDRVEFIDEVPKTSVGKFDKKVLRARFASQTAAPTA